MVSRRGKVAPGRVFKVAAGRRGASDFLFVDGELVMQADDPSAARRSRSRVALATWNSHVHFLDAALYRLGEVYSGDGRPEDSQRMFRQVADEYPYTEWGRRAAQRLQTATR